MTTVITPLPTPVPTRADPTNFASRADTFLTALPPFAVECNSLASELNALATNVENNNTISNNNLTAMNTLYTNTTALQHFVGVWSNLTGSLTVPSVVYHNGSYWLLKTALANVTTQEPSVTNTTYWLRYSLNDFITVNKNRCINGGMQVSQRGATTVTLDNYNFSKYGADRTETHWINFTAGSMAVSSAYDAGTGKYYNKAEISSSTGSTGRLVFIHKIESINTYDLNSKKVTVSFVLYHGLATSSTINVALTKPNAKDDYNSGSTTIATNSITVSPYNTNRQSITFTLGNTDATNGFYVGIGVPIGSVTSKGVFLGELQLEEGSVASPFEYRNIADTLVQCQRYLRPYTGFGTFDRTVTVSLTTWDIARLRMSFPSMRTTPTFSTSGSGTTVVSCPLQNNGGRSDIACSILTTSGTANSYDVDIKGNTIDDSNASKMFFSKDATAFLSAEL